VLRSTASRATVLATPLLLGALAVPSGGLFRGAKFRDLHLYRQYGDALLAGHLPYRDVFVEYPPGAIPLFAGPSLAPEGAYDAIFKVLMTLCCIGAIYCVCFVLERSGSRPAGIWTGALFLALSPIALGPVSLNTYDAWPALVTVAAVAALVTDRGRFALALLGMAAAAKLYAVLLVPVAVVWLWKERGRRQALESLGVFAATAVVLVVPWIAISPGGVWDSLHAQVGRGLHTESLGASILLVADRIGWYQAHVVSTAPAISRDVAGDLPHAIAAASAGLAILAALVPAAVLLFRRVSPGLAFATSVAGFLAFTKVLSPQYVVWLIPLVPFGGIAAMLLLLAALALAQSWYFHYHDLWAVGPQAWTLLSRNLVLLALYALLLWKTSTPSSSKTSRQPPFLRSRTSAAAEGSGATRST
jgi:uncharacterized membrane protein